MGSTLTLDEQDILRMAITTRRGTIRQFREAPNIHKSDDWAEEDEALDRVENAVIGLSLDGLDRYDIVQVLVGLQFLIMDALEWKPGWMESEGPKYIAMNNRLAELVGDDE